MICDMHTHSDISIDSQATMASFCETALTRGVAVLCFTDHLDSNPVDAGLGYYDCERYFRNIETVREQYGDRLTILSGIEFGEPHRYPKIFEEVQQYPYDYILGSVHYWQEGVLPNHMPQSIPCVEESFTIFWEEVKAAVSHGGFDALAHLDYPSRYYKASHYEKEVMEEIFAIMQKNNIIPEINTAATRRGVNQPNPSYDLIKLYRECGGQYITMGADAHRIESFAAGIPEELAKAEALGLQQVYFKQRQMILATD